MRVDWLIKLWLNRISNRTHHRVRRGRQLETLKTRHVMGMGVRVRVGVDGWRRRGRESLVKAARDAHPRVIHVVLHRWVHRVMMLRRACNHNYYYPRYYFYYSLSLSLTIDPCIFTFVNFFSMIRACNV